ncbi:MAG: UDP-N-acetylglucosamine 1-carboxyvinyltransferase [Bdellovibrionales bacterium]
MDKIVVRGGVKLNGEVSTSGAKNSVLPLMFSSLLCDGTHKFYNVPDLADVRSAINLLTELGANCSLEDGELIIDMKSTGLTEARYDLVRKMRASVLTLGPLLARFGEACVSLPGGCAIGTRPIDLHIDAMKALDATIEIKNGYVHASGKLKGSSFLFDVCTVGGTENLLMAASLADGTTYIENAAKEPEIVDLAEYLIKMGAKIEGAGTSIIKVIGVSKLSPSSHSVVADRIEAGTLLIAGAITGGTVQVNKCVPEHLEALISKMRESGFEISTGKDFVKVFATKDWKGVDVTTATHPGFATDLQAQFMALMTQAKGSSVITESIFENRFMHVPELTRLGANIQPKSRVAVVKENEAQLEGAPVMATDLRASASLVLAGLVAKGETTVNRVYHLDRGYDRLENKLASLGADIERKAE